VTTEQQVCVRTATHCKRKRAAYPREVPSSCCLVSSKILGCTLRWEFSMWRKSSKVFCRYVQRVQDGLFYLCRQVQKRSPCFTGPTQRGWNVKELGNMKCEKVNRVQNAGEILIPVLLRLILQHDWSQSTTSSVWV
jgi:hypothetical protein